jgi:hypothetical protein
MLHHGRQSVGNGEVYSVRPALKRFDWQKFSFEFLLKLWAFTTAGPVRRQETGLSESNSIGAPGQKPS